MCDKLREKKTLSIRLAKEIPVLKLRSMQQTHVLKKKKKHC